jgi:hypothetical protein
MEHVEERAQQEDRERQRPEHVRPVLRHQVERGDRGEADPTMASGARRKNRS